MCPHRVTPTIVLHSRTRLLRGMGEPGAGVEARRSPIGTEEEMDADRFDQVARALFHGMSRRTALSLALATIVTNLGPAEGDARRRRNRKKRRQQQQQCGSCGVCESCQQGACRPVANGTACGDCQTCQGGQCASTCQGGQVCQQGTCACAAGSKNCQGTCIPNDQCCGTCPQNQVCCTNVGECKDVRNDSAFCGLCTNGQCPTGAFCANGACGLTCNTDGGACFDPDCFCAERVDPAHAAQKVCARLIAASCPADPECNADADCAPDTLGFREVCVSDLCSVGNVCARPCA